jgi:hypothetical protein
MMDQGKIGGGMDNEPRGPEVGDLAPEFFVELGHSRLVLSNLAARSEKLILMSQDSYQFHPN